MSTSPNACLIIIGNEILSGRTQDKNLNWLALKLNEYGVRLAEVRVIPDVEDTIIAAVTTCSNIFDYVFTTGGIGPTHDDITAACMAKAFGVKLQRHPEAERRLLAHYTPDLVNEARMRMANIPEGAELIDNPVSAAPGFKIRNVYVMAGVPSIMQAMFDSIKHTLKGGAVVQSRSVSAYITEGTIAAELTAIQARHHDIEIGSYPFMRSGRLGVSLVMRGADEKALEHTSEEVRVMVQKYTTELFEE